MFSHITVGVSDLDRAARFYNAMLGPLGLEQRTVTPDGDHPEKCWVGPGGGPPRFFAYLPFDAPPARPATEA